MPSYITHALMGRKTYDVYSKIKGFKIEISKSAFKTFSLGVDLANGYKGVADIAHNKDTGLLIISMVDYIKRNNLSNNSNVLSILYGHIVHYFLDTNTHPYIYYIEKGMKRNGLISPHVFIEGSIDSFLTKDMLDCDIFDLDGRTFCLKGEISDNESKEMIDYLYLKLYNIKGMNISYKLVLKFFMGIEKITKSNLFKDKKEAIKKILRIDGYLKKYKLNKEVTLNSNHEDWLHPVTGNIHSESFDDLFNKSIDSSLNAIEMVDKVIYDGLSIDILYKLFPNISYDTGMDCNIGRVFKYKKY